MPPISLITECRDQIVQRIDDQQSKISNRELLDICRPLGEIRSGELNPHFPHEIAECAINYLVENTLARELLTSQNPITSYLDRLKPLAERLPTQTWRSDEQDKWQQFSTPTGIAYLLAFLLNLKPHEQVLEPSAGTGSLAVWASGIGLVTYTNEIESRRRDLLQTLGFQPTSFNAEFLHDFLPSEIQPDCILMNPPFSSSGGRTKNNSSKFGFRHVESAIERLNPGGKFGIILGTSGGLETKTGREFWQKLSAKVLVKAILRIDGKEYSKNGTSVDVNLIIGNKKQTPDKYQNNSFASEIITLSFASVEDGFSALSKFDLRLQ